MSSDLAQHNATLLTPNILSEAEAALYQNAGYQSSCAGRPQPTTPPAGPGGSNYLAACAAAGMSSAIPHPWGPAAVPSEEPSDNSSVGGSSVTHEDDAQHQAWARMPLSRGTTAAVLAKMSSGDCYFGGSELGRRVSRGSIDANGNAGHRPLRSKTVGDEPAAQNPPTPEEQRKILDRQQSWTKDDMKRAFMQQFLHAPDRPSEYGYSSHGGTPMYTG